MGRIIRQSQVGRTLGTNQELTVGIGQGDRAILVHHMNRPALYAFSKDLTEGVWHVVYENGKGEVTRLADDAACNLITDMPAFSQIVHGYESYGMEVAQYMHGVEILGDCKDFFRAFPNRPAGAFDLF